MERKILFVLASNTFRDCEYLVPRAFFEQAGFEVCTASTKKISTGRFGYQVPNTYLIEEVKQQEFEGIYFVGGGGSAEYADNKAAQTLFKAFLTNNKPIAAICAAPRNFLKWGLLENKKATGFDADGVFSELALQYGATAMPGEKVVTDGLILTANGPEASEESALKYMELLNRINTNK